MAFYVKNDESHEVKRISNLSDLHTWGGATEKIKDVINSGFEEKLLNYLEDYAPEISEHGFPIWIDTELNDYLWYNEDSWKGNIGLLHEDEMVELIKESLQDHWYFNNFSDLAEKYNFLPDINVIREKLLSDDDRLFQDNDEYENRKDSEIFDELLQKHGDNLTSLYKELHKSVKNVDKVANVFLNETLYQLDKRVSQFTYNDIHKLYKNLIL